jgi:Zn-dependent M16 (insulinase) family peptidase
MARGWESKSVEAQQEEVATRDTSDRPHLTSEEAAITRATENYRLALRNILQQLNVTHEPRRREMLEQAKADLEQKIQHVGKQGCR